MTCTRSRRNGRSRSSRSRSRVFHLLEVPVTPLNGDERAMRSCPGPLGWWGHELVPCMVKLSVVLVGSKGMLDVTVFRKLRYGTFAVNEPCGAQ